MKGAKTAPFLQVDPRSVECSPWMIGGGRALQDGDLIREWDQSLDLAVSRVVRVDMAMVAQTAKLGPGSKLALVSSWWSDGTNLRGCGDISNLVVQAAGKVEQVQLGMQVPGSNLAGNLKLKCTLVLSEPPKGAGRGGLAAVRPGSILWEDGLFVTLEGRASRFPISVVDFEQSSIGPKDACWVLEWSPRDLHLPAMASLRLHINSGHGTFHRAVTAPTPRDVDLAIRSALKYEVAEEMVRLALDHVDDLEGSDGDFPPASAGRVFLDLLSSVFPERTPRQLRDMRASDPSMFHARVQSQVRLYAGLDVEASA